MSSLRVVDARTGEVIDTVTLTGAGELVYETGSGRPVVEGMRRAAGRRGGVGLSEPQLTAQVFELLRGGWSNGYTATEAA